MTGLTPRRPDQHTNATPRTVQPGQRILQIANNKTGLPITTQDGGVLNAVAIHGYAGDGVTTTLIPAGANVRGAQLWAIALSSLVADLAAPAPLATTDDTVQDSTGVIYMSLANGLGAAGQSTSATMGDLRGIKVPAGRSVSLVNGMIGIAGCYHKTSATLVYSLL